MWRVAMKNSTQAIDLTAPRRARGAWLLLALFGALGLLPAESATPQEGSAAGITWNRMFRLADGRLFVTDGAITLAVEFAKPRELPTTELPATAGDVMGRYMAAEPPDEFELDDLEQGTEPQTYEAPSGVTIAAKWSTVSP